MRYFPIFVDLDHRRVVVVGGGEEATRKIRLLLKTKAVIEVIAAELHPELAGNSRVVWTAKMFDPALLDGAALVYSADKELNARVSSAAQARSIPVNAVDEAEISTFIVPSIVDRDPVVVAIGTEGTAPVLGQGIRGQIDALLPQSIGPLARKAADLRKAVADIVPAGNRRRGFWQRFFFGDVREAHESGDAVAFELSLQDALFLETRPAAGRLTCIVAENDPDLLTLKALRRLQEADVILHDGSAPGLVLEMARRDAVRLQTNGSETLQVASAELAKGMRLVRLLSAASIHVRSEITSLLQAGVTVETLGTPQSHVPNHSTPFPVRDDLRDAILRAAT